MTMLIDTLKFSYRNTFGKVYQNYHRVKGISGRLCPPKLL